MANSKQIKSRKAKSKPISRKASPVKKRAAKAKVVKTKNLTGEVYYPSRQVVEQATTMPVCGTR
jgi:hypothetical protein